ncbi:CBS domain-containing protein [Pseudomonas sp. sp1636]|uniref:CBS domain-containing protein n=1 Tax=Pseudomonas sp. sp1636 TaxID=3036707 RepID=UPI0025A629E7|nr:CBS domain-containing protein [Pseudomonas sp. sp1636]MDM8348154.1 CBS domain-containing protein [Pseudomonas sp. sp1636]
MNTVAIADYMTQDFATIRADMPVVEAARKLLRRRILGGPVTDAQGRLLGWISEQECLQVAIQVAYYNQRVATVRDIMRTDVLSVTPDMDALTLAQQMLGDKPKSYPVVDAGGKVVGVITRRHILKLLDDLMALPLSRSA